MLMYMYMLIIITHLVLKLVIHYKYTFVLQPLTQATVSNHAFVDTAIELDYFCWLFMDDMLEMIIVRTNLSALQNEYLSLIYQVYW